MPRPTTSIWVRGSDDARRSERLRAAVPPPKLSACGIRNDKLYNGRTEHWGDFCTRYLKMTKQNADRIIRLLEEFGPGYFQLSQITRISPETYRQKPSGTSRLSLQVRLNSALGADAIE